MNYNDIPAANLDMKAQHVANQLVQRMDELMAQLPHLSTVQESIVEFNKELAGEPNTVVAVKPKPRPKPKPKPGPY